MPTASQNQGRLEARINPAQKDIIQQAADLQGRTLTDFVISCAQAEAKKVIQEHKIISLTQLESTNFANALLQTDEPNTALKKAAKQHSSILQNKS